ncbi:MULTISPECIES: hypothetical protein [unclassified Pseudodesulfovibrio]|uniref:hypothetical protein n=1 Tax=unclassified Pseudodesulfovibrio TaxID=2661612 RepID=UPI000FEB7E39|nr:MULTISPECIES: hypothetical protein [unclassified Pseudodesulfovibrio]MCJ2164109.1 hypothetical protein [Pseudodesulfovibrio sp. S3-i]RWU05261.1 hypothetical protein DWB63_06290 [Pseudodesulfovibrio sp. S3]
MDLSLVERENTLLGQDFLTWLWYKTDRDTILFALKDKRTFTLQMEQKLSVQGGEGETKATATVSSPAGELSEAKTGLSTGKKVSKAQLLFAMDQDNWLVTVNAADFGLSGLKTPKINTKDDDGDDPDAKFLEKLFLVERCLEMFDVVYNEFLKLRMSKQWAEEAASVKLWING